MRCLYAFLSFALFAASAPAQDLVAKTDAKTPEEERKAFKLPKGFEAQLIAAEPDIQKPMQMAFDTKGRLWVTTSHLYPWAAEAGKGTDRLYVLSEFDEKGKAKTIKIFDEKLNIPIGVLPLDDGKSVIVSEAGSILKLTDTNGDGKADQREVLYTGFGYKDTHGMTNSFTPMPDGWIYATHGFNNNSKVKGKDGHEITMYSGHSFRFKADGSRIEIYTHGQVNPFGIAVDPWGNLYTACCHSKPITQLIRGAYYDHFGNQPHDGLGFGPHVVNHQHGSTGLCGLAWGAGPMFPKEWDGVMLLGNVVTNRINCDRIEWHGSTPVGKELPDFLSSDDPWFRPVDLKFGPDGALYVSDFYNKIIGHYEVDLKHPGRDNLKGRLWRIVYTGPKRTEKDFEADQLDEIKSLRKLAGEAKPSVDERKSIVAALAGKPRTARAAVDTMTAQPNADFVASLVAFIPKVPDDDNHMKHAARIALKQCLQAPDAWGEIKKDLTPAEGTVLLDIAATIPSKEPGAWMMEYFQKLRTPHTDRIRIAEYFGRQDDAQLWITILKYVDAFINERTTTKIVAFQQDYFAALLKGARNSKPPQDKGILGLHIEELTADSFRHGAPEVKLAAAKSFQAWVAASKPTEYQNPKKLGLAIKWALENDSPSFELRTELLMVQYLTNPAMSRPQLRRLAGEPTLPAVLKSQIFAKILTEPTIEDCGFGISAIKTAPYSLALNIATGLSGDKLGADLLLLSIQKGEAPARLLQEKAVVDRLKATKVKDIDVRLKDLTKGIPAPEKRIDDLIKKRGDGFKNVKADVAKGKEIFTKNCAVCHQINNEGAKVGPQLDGVGIRGLDRLLEDTLDPNRNVDAAFKATTLQLVDGRSPTGLVREEGAVYVLVDSLGKEERIPAKDVDKVVKSTLSAMPANVDAIIPEADYYHLLAYLLSQRPK